MITFADYVGNGVAGSTPWQITSGLNHWLGANSYDTVGSVDNNRLFSGVMRAVNANSGPVHSQSIPWGGGPFLEAHYIVITGYKWDDYEGGGPMYQVWDPQSDSYHELRADSWQSMAYLETLASQIISPNDAAV